MLHRCSQHRNGATTGTFPSMLLDTPSPPRSQRRYMAPRSNPASRIVCAAGFNVPPMSPNRPPIRPGERKGYDGVQGAQLETHNPGHKTKRRHPCGCRRFEQAESEAGLHPRQIRTCGEHQPQRRTGWHRCWSRRRPNHQRPCPTDPVASRPCSSCRRR